MAEPDARDPASAISAMRNTRIIAGESGRRATVDDYATTSRLRRELREKGIQGFRRGGRVHRTGIYKLHRGERVIPARSRRGRRR